MNEYSKVWHDMCIDRMHDITKIINVLLQSVATEIAPVLSFMIISSLLSSIDLSLAMRMSRHMFKNVFCLCIQCVILQLEISHLILRILYP